MWASPGLWRSWLANVTLGELLGFCVPAIVGALVLGQRPLVALWAMVLAGGCEGLVLGLAQASVLRRELSGFSSRDWTLVTSLAAAGAWLLGMLPSTFASTWAGWPVPLLAAVAGVLGVLLLVSIGAAQWLVLRRHVQQAGRWVPASALAWCIGLAAFSLVTSPLWHEGQDAGMVAAIGLAGGAVMAATMAAVTGWALVRLVAQPAAPCRSAGSTRSAYISIIGR